MVLVGESSALIPVTSGVPHRSILGPLLYMNSISQVCLSPGTKILLYADNIVMYRRGKLNSQFIVTRVSILHAGGQSLFRFHISLTDTFSMIARDKKHTILCSPAFRVLRRS